MRRYKAGGLANSIVVVLLIAIVLAVPFQRKAETKAEMKAERERQKGVKVTDFMAKLFETNNPWEYKGETLTARQILDRGAQKLRNELKDQPEVQAELMNKVGN